MSTQSPSRPVPPEPAATAVQPSLRAERPDDAAFVEGLIGRAFGPGRFAKTAERLREQNHPLLDVSMVAWAGDTAVGCVRLWPVHIGDRPAVLLGPFAVEDAWRSRGLGARLIAAACDAAARAGHRVVILVGDAAYFSKLGFEAVPVGRAMLTGPVDERRLLWRALAPGALDGVEGAVTAG